MPKADEELLLIYAEDKRPQWLVVERDGNVRVPLLETRIREHLSKLRG
jgi:hypothetical protein